MLKRFTHVAVCTSLLQPCLSLGERGAWAVGRIHWRSYQTHGDHYPRERRSPLLFCTVPVKELDPGVGQVLRRLISCPEQIWDDPSMFWMQYLRMWTIFQELDTQECFVCRPYLLCAVVLRLSPFPILVLVAFSVRMVCFLPSSSCRATCMFPPFAISTVFWAGRTWRRCTLICGPLF